MEDIFQYSEYRGKLLQHISTIDDKSIGNIIFNGEKLKILLPNPGIR